MLLLAAAMIAASAPTAEQAAIFKAAGFTRAAGKWHTDCDQPDSGYYGPGQIESYQDLNGDGRPEAVVTEGGTFCYGNTGTCFWLLSKQSSGAWKVLHQSQGIAEFLKTTGVNKMPDISVGGPGFCFPVLRWNGKAFVHNRWQYEGKACKPPRP
jgi:hypothetical protein